MFSDLFHKGKVWSYYIKYYNWLFSEIRLPNNIYSWSNSSFRWMSHCWMAASLAIPLSGLLQTDHSFAIIFLPLKVIQFWSGISGLKVYLPCQSSKNTQALSPTRFLFPPFQISSTVSLNFVLHFWACLDWSGWFSLWSPSKGRYLGRNEEMKLEGINF